MINPDTGHIHVTLPKKRELTLPEDYHIPLKKKTVGTNPSPPYIPPASPTDPNLLISPQNSPPPPTSPDPHGDGDDNEDPPQDTHPWQDYHTDPDNDPDLYLSRPCPPDDNIGYVELLNRAAQYHGMELHSEPLEQDFLFETLSSSHRATHTLPMLKGMLKHTGHFQTPCQSKNYYP